MSLPVRIFTLALDAFPFLPWQLATFNRLKCDWKWLVVEGAAANVGTTSWCQAQPPRLSQDGTTNFLNSLRGHPRVRTFQRQWWDGGKDQMVDTALESIYEPCVLLEVDADELWESSQIERLVKELERGGFNCARFDCNYYVGPNIRLTVPEGHWSKRGEWLRAWRFEPGMKMTHEPPNLYGVNGPNERPLTNERTRELGLVFEHWAYVFREQVAFKERFYGYKGAVEQWERLQRNTIWPIKSVMDFLPWFPIERGANLIWR